jgi:hypothetical protein
MADVIDRVRAPRPVAPEKLQAAFLPGVSSLLFGLVQPRDGALWLGPWQLLRFGPPESVAGGVRWPVRGGLLGTGGEAGFKSTEGELTGWVRGFHPSPLYRPLFGPVHHAATRLYLLRLRGREPLPGYEAGLRSRWLAFGVDAVLCLCAGVLVRRRSATVALAAGYHIAAWSLGGKTLGGWLLRQRVVAVDGTPVSPLQAVARLLFGDRYAGTAVIEDSAPASQPSAAP